MCKYVEYGKNNLSRQEISGFFYDDGNVYVIKGDLVKSGDRYGEHNEKVLLNKEQNVEIDEEYDFWLAQQILSKRTQK